MASTKSGGTAKNLTDSNPKYLGIKLYDGEFAGVGSVIVRQRGTRILPGKNVGVGKDHTLFALSKGIISYGQKRMTRFDNTTSVKRVVHVVEVETKDKNNAEQKSVTKTQPQKIVKSAKRSTVSKKS